MLMDLFQLKLELFIYFDAFNVCNINECIKTKMKIYLFYLMHLAVYELK